MFFGGPFQPGDVFQFNPACHNIRPILRKSYTRITLPVSVLNIVDCIAESTRRAFFYRFNYLIFFLAIRIDPRLGFHSPDLRKIISTMPGM